MGEVQQWWVRGWGGCLPTPRHRWGLLGVVLVLVVLVLVRLLVLDTLVWDGAGHAAPADYTDGWSWSVLPQHSPTLRAKVQGEMEPPSPRPYNLDRPNIGDHSQNGQSCFVATIFAHQRKQPRWFLEAGAYNGEDLSNSLYLERRLGWQGLLVEPDPWNYWSLKKRRRRAHTLNACLAPNAFASKQMFRQSDTMSRLARPGESSQGRGIFTSVTCYPLYTVLLAANRTKLDYLALDLEGLELKVLQTLPWDAVQITVLQVEASHLREKERPSAAPQPRENKGKRHLQYYTSHNNHQNEDAQEISPNSLKNIPKKPPQGKVLAADAGVQPVGKFRTTDENHENTEQNNCNEAIKVKDPRLNKYSKEQYQMINFLKNKKYTFAAVIGEDFIFVRRDLILS